MDALFTIENLFTLMLLVMLQAVLGFDNLLYISIESKRVAPKDQARLRKLGIGIAVVLRVALLFVVMKVLSLFQEELFAFNWQGVIEGHFNLHSLVVLVGGIFILYTALKEITHMMSFEEDQHIERKPRSFATSLFWIVTMNVVFSFDSILSAMALSDNYYVMATAIIIGGILMMWLADGVSNFLQKNRMYEVVGLFILFLVGVMLISEGGHISHLTLLGHTVEPLSKTTFYLVIFIMVLVDIVQSRYQKKLLAIKKELSAKT
ncbi:MAG TPA: tellurium resistance protein TerC [Thiotrichaceae bacterium]|nr:tellurium resistance protein TerC [Thiotrichaceae bacterium]